MENNSITGAVENVYTIGKWSGVCTVPTIILAHGSVTNLMELGPNYLVAANELACVPLKREGQGSRNYWAPPNLRTRA